MIVVQRANRLRLHTEDVDVSSSEGVSVYVAGVALNHLQVGRSVSAVLAHAGDCQVAIAVRQRELRRQSLVCIG